MRVLSFKNESQIKW